MIILKKENGFPISIKIETSEAEDLTEDWVGYISQVFDENDKVITEFCHSNLYERDFWTKGFIEGIKY